MFDGGDGERFGGGSETEGVPLMVTAVMMKKMRVWGFERRRVFWMGRKWLKQFLEFFFLPYFFPIAERECYECVYSGADPFMSG